MMASTLTMARKELRGLFASPVALLFLGVFLASNLFLFFSWERFFARGLADVRPLFDWLPLLLVFLVSAVTMRAWAEERRSGTLEVLLTLPVPTASLVAGKFVAGMALVTLALGLTLPIPLTVALLGPLDPGPVVGGYVAALCLAAAYLSLGLLVSSRTDNQVVALLLTLLVGGALYGIGADGLQATVSASTAEVLAALGTGSRFDSIERGVLDLRDLAYYLGLTATFLVANAVSLEQLRLDPDAPAGRRRRWQLWGVAGLVAANAAALVLWLAPVHAARADLTADGEFTLSPVTTDLVRTLEEPLVVRALLTARTHEKLAPLLPQVADTLEELAVVGGDKVRVEVVDPSLDPELEQQLVEQYGIRPVPFAVADRHSQAVVNAYFHVLFEYAGAHEVLSFEDLVDVRLESTDIQVRLKNLEYDLARTIQKVSRDLSSLDTLLAKVPEGTTLTAYVTPELLPEAFREPAATFERVAREVAEQSGGRVSFEAVDPSGDADLQQRLLEEMGVQPLAADILGTQRFYLHLVLAGGDQVEPIYPRAQVTEADVRQALEAAVKRMVPGQRKTVALLTEQPDAPPPNPNLPHHMQPPPPRADYQGLKATLSERFDVRSVDLADGYVPDEVDMVLVAKPGALSDEQRFALDQYLMQGGSIVALAGSHQVEARSDLRATAAADELTELLADWGACVGDGLVMSEANVPFPIPVSQTMGGFRMQRIELLPYPFFPDLRQGQMADHPALSGIAAMTMPWSTPVEACEAELDGREVVELLHVDGAVQTDGRIQPDFTRGPAGFALPGEPERHSLALALTGRFPSAFAGQSSPLFDGDEGKGKVLESSVADGRLLVIGSAELASDLMLQIANQGGNEVHRGNLQLVHNAVDWAVEDTALLSIRSAGAFARVLLPVDAKTAQLVELRTWLFTGALLVGVLALSHWMRRRRVALPLEA
jgi:ABC-2 type transport system permease protein